MPITITIDGPTEQEIADRMIFEKIASLDSSFRCIHAIKEKVREYYKYGALDEMTGVDAANKVFEDLNQIIKNYMHNYDLID